MLATQLFGGKRMQKRRASGHCRRLALEPLEGRQLLAGINLVESGAATVVRERGGSDTVAVSLAEAPASDVVLNVVSSNPAQVMASPTTLTFTPGDWNLARTITLTGVNDSMADGAGTTNLVISVVDAVSDDAYDPVPDAIISVATIDDETPIGGGLEIVSTFGSTVVSETGTTDAFTVALLSQPTSNVVLNISNGDSDEVSVAPASLTFTPANWNMPQAVIATGSNDTVRDGDETTKITIAVNDALSDDAFDRVPDQTVRVTTLDDEVRPPAPGTAIVVSDPQNPTGQMLVVTGTSDNDSIRVRREGRDGVELAVRISGQLDRAFDSTGIGRIQIIGGHGNDTIQVAEEVAIPVQMDGGAGNDEMRGGGGNDQLFGGAGNDRMFGGPGNDIVRGGQGNDRLIEHEGNDILLGGVGNDDFSGGDGRDMLIGGSGNDRIEGQDDDDILIGGNTRFDNNDAALQALLSEWTSDRSFGIRRANLQAGTGEILAGTRLKLVQQKTVFRSGRDDLDGGDGENLVFFPTRQNKRNRGSSGSSGNRGNRRSSSSGGDRISGNDFPEFKPVRDQFRDAGLDLADSARSLFRR